MFETNRITMQLLWTMMNGSYLLAELYALIIKFVACRLYLVTVYYRATLCVSAVFAVAWCPSVCALQFLEFVSIYAHTLCRRTTKFDVVTHMGRWLVFRWSATSSPQGGGAPALPNFAVPIYLCVHPLSQNHQIWRGNTCGERRVSWSQPRLPSQKSGAPSLPNFGGSPVFIHIPFNA